MSRYGRPVEGPGDTSESDYAVELQAIHADMASLVQRNLRTRRLAVRWGCTRNTSFCAQPKQTMTLGVPRSRRSFRSTTSSRSRRPPTHANWSAPSPCMCTPVPAPSGWVPLPCNARAKFEIFRVGRSPARPQPRHGTRFASRASPLHVWSR